ncbi:MAG: RNA methyltransferase [Bifidobacteriaceae bacterium]|jgi:TrmH family RNA methyltransferase|nr:RNA methyltransferase [Bifidobacteriaceae bacterium]MCI1914749.1 RNA methyltransferase [Bifidobacteriaceae bacterium]
MPKAEHFIDNVHSDRVRRVADLASSRARKKTGKFLIEGPQAVREAVTFRPDLVDDVYVDTNADPHLDIVSAALKNDLYVHDVTSEVLARISKDAQSVVAVGRSEGLILDSAAATKNATAIDTAGAGLIAACWQVRDPGNEGTVIRTADASGCRAVVLVGDCVDPLNPKVIRATAGSLFHLPLVRMNETEFFDWARSQEVAVWAADIHGTAGKPPIDLASSVFSGPSASESAGPERGGLSVQRPTAVLFGNEARGLPSEMVAQADLTVKIPLYGKAESLNLAMSSAVLLYTLAMSSHVGRM